ncbi:MAG: hypothetical protein GY714_20345 [Desulfobacterales bacterium]|nr:hypothetical protein [Desulfobacterales bacterium]
MRKNNTGKKSKIDHSVDFLTESLGKKLPPKKVSRYPRGSKLAGPWKYDFKNKCKKCNRVFHLQKHHITYDPSLTVFLCEHHHDRITAVNTTAAKIFHTSKYHKPTYTNQIRVILWRWFIDNPWPKKNGSPVKTLETSLLKKIVSEYKLSPLRPPSGNAGEQPGESHGVSAFKLSLSNLGVTRKNATTLCVGIGNDT